MNPDQHGIFSLGSATVGARVRKRRIACELTTKQLAEALRLGGCSNGESWWIERLEAGEIEVSVDELLLLAVVLDASPAWLMIPSGITSPDDTIWLPGAPREHLYGVATRRRAGAVWNWLAGFDGISWAWAMQVYPPTDIAAKVGFGGTQPPDWHSGGDEDAWYSDGGTWDGKWDGVWDGEDL